MKKTLLLLVAFAATITAGAQPLRTNEFNAMNRVSTDDTRRIASPNALRDMSRSSRIKGRPQPTAESDFTIIRDTPEGELRVYTRTGGCTYNQANEEDGKVYTYCGSLDGTTAVLCFAPDGKTVYFRDIIYTAEEGTWVKGTISGNTITIPSGQAVSYSSGTYSNGTTWEAALLIGMYRFNSRTNWFDATGGAITYTIDNTRGTITLNNTSAVSYDDDGYVNFPDVTLSLYYSDDNSWSGYSEFGAVLTPNPVVTPPADLQADAYLLDATVYGETDPIVGAPAAVGRVDNVVFVKGLNPAAPEQWAAGTVSADGKTIVFEQLQVMGINSETCEPIELYSFTPNVGMGDVVFTYDAETDTYNQGSYFVIIETNAYQKIKIYPNTTGIRSIDNGQLTMSNAAAVYDLQGRKIINNAQLTINNPDAPANCQLKPGIYVVNGRKFVVK